MREILFRGQNEHGVWVYGMYIPYQNGEAAILYEKFSAYGYEATELCQRSKVIPETVGQFTGLTDRNGNKIFEGDVIKGKVHEIYGYRTVNATVEFDVANSRFALKHKNGYKNIPFIGEVIGNIHDNPELLKGDREDNE